MSPAAMLRDDPNKRGVEGALTSTTSMVVDKSTYKWPSSNDIAAIFGLVTAYRPITCGDCGALVSITTIPEESAAYTRSPSACKFNKYPLASKFESSVGVAGTARS